MEIESKKTVDMLTPESVSILTQQFTFLNNNEVQVGENHRCAYINSESGRAQLAINEPEEVVASVLAMWGDNPTIQGGAD